MTTRDLNPAIRTKRSAHCSNFVVRCLEVLLFALLLSSLSTAQTFTVLHAFSGQSDGATPVAGVTLDAAGNVYGTAKEYGEGHWGVVYKLANRNAGWVFTPLYSFQGGSDGMFPNAGVTIGPDNTLFGTTYYGGAPLGCSGQDACGTVYNIRPPSRPTGAVMGAWTEKHVYSFPGFAEGAYPQSGVTFDASGANMYGTTSWGGTDNAGTVYQLSRSGGSWEQSVIYSFPSGADSPGCSPLSGVIIDPAGNLYGTAPQCGINNNGAVYMLTPSADGWVETTIHQFTGGADGMFPEGGLLRDSAGNLYGATVAGGSGGAGVIYQLQPNGGSWTFNVLYSLVGCYLCGPWGALASDQSGNLYGATNELGAYAYGNIFRLSPSSGGWTYTSLHDFNYSRDGGYPYGWVSIDPHGNVYGTTSVFGRYGYGTVWELTP